MTPGQKNKLKEKTTAYMNFEFSYNNVISKWDETLEKTISNFKQNIRAVPRYEVVKLQGKK
jgi:RNase P/RNase MRP subunit p30